MKSETYVRQMEADGKTYDIVDITLLEKSGFADIQRLPYSIRILVENLLRKLEQAW